MKKARTMRMARSENFAENSTFVCGPPCRSWRRPLAWWKRDGDCSSPSTGYSGRTTPCRSPARRRPGPQPGRRYAGKSGERAAVQQPEHALRAGCAAQRRASRSVAATPLAETRLRALAVLLTSRRPSSVKICSMSFCSAHCPGDGQERIAGVNENSASGVKAR